MLKFDHLKSYLCKAKEKFLLTLKTPQIASLMYFDWNLYFRRDEGFSKCKNSLFSSPRQISFLIWKIYHKTDIYKPFCCVLSPVMVTFKNILPIVLFHNNIWVFKRISIFFLRGVYYSVTYKVRALFCATFIFSL